MNLKKKIFEIKEKLARFVMLIATHVFGPVFWRWGVVFLTRHNANPLRIGEIAHQFDLYEKIQNFRMGGQRTGNSSGAKRSNIKPMLYRVLAAIL